MKEFDKIYIAKYHHILTKRQLAEDLNTNTKMVEEVLNELTSKGMLEIYNSMSDYEWDKLEKFKDEEIKIRYYKKSKIIQEKTFSDILNVFKVDLHETINSFPKYNHLIVDFEDFYMQENDYKNEIWKKIGTLNYEVSNYGRIKNIQTKKLKKLKHQIYGMQVLLWQNSKSYTITISRLVAEMFIRHLEKNERAVHIDGNAKNNYYKNLRIVSK